MLEIYLGGITYSIQVIQKVILLPEENLFYIEVSISFAKSFVRYSYHLKTSFHDVNRNDLIGISCLLCFGLQTVKLCYKTSLRTSTRLLLKGLQLQEVGDFEAQNCLPPMNLIRSTKLHLTTEPPIYCRCCQRVVVLIYILVSSL